MSSDTNNPSDQEAKEAFYRRLKPEGKRMILSIDGGGAKGYMTLQCLAKLEDLMGFLLPLYVREGRSYLRIGVGCTGGKHRSVAVVERLARVLAGQGTRLKVHHRDMERA